MFRKTDLKAVAAVIVGVFLAGYIMHMFRDVTAVDQARAGFGG